ncbi:helical bundle domain-containing protein [Legionella drancourtii]|uniref:Uncharacterized protein n=1 Tax=Legionella drancourtii LLAP12 TaxID=658187 RepID=G9ET11_9GAMM|nr:helical bundle domain-containing protein [Legionella drancourtii]EHL29478.1 hypothetical protein LDG_8440 [Legionella drancourtii LLAP12]
MLSSSSAYRIALHDGDYLRFLEWPAFIEKKYREGNNPLGSDALMDCLIFEWLNCGYSQKDIEQITLLYAIYELNPSPLQVGKYAFPLMTIMSALFSCMTFHGYCAQGDFMPVMQMTEKQISRFMEEKTAEMGRGHFDEVLSSMRDKFMQQITSVDEISVNMACKKINEIVEPLTVLEEYLRLLNLVHAQECSNPLYNTRLGIVQSFFSYLREQTELSEDRIHKMIIYVNAIRCHQPEAWEEEHLHKIFPPTLVEKTWGLFTYLSRGLLTIVLPANEHTHVTPEPGNAPKI